MDCSVASCDFNSFNFFFLYSLLTIFLVLFVNGCELPFQVTLRKRDAGIADEAHTSGIKHDKK